MDLSVWSKGVPPSTKICLGSCSAQYFPLQPDALLSDADTAETKNGKNTEERKMMPYFHCNVCNATSSFIQSGHHEVDLSQDTGHIPVGGHHLPPAARNFNRGHCAKRARVENIIKGMTATPAGHMAETATNRGSVSQSQVTKTHLEYRQLRLRTNLTACGESQGTSVSAPHADPNSKLEKTSSVNTQQVCEPTNLAQSKPERIKLMAEVLKYELSRAVSHSVDSIFSSLPLLQTPADDHHDGRSSSSWPPVCNDNEARALEARREEVQAEALSLVVQEACQRRPGPLASFSCCDSKLRSGTSQETRSAAAQNDTRPRQNLGVGLTKPDMSNDCWNSVTVRSKVNSRLARSLPVDGPHLRSLCLPLVKMESEEMVGNNLCMADVSF